MQNIPVRHINSSQKELAAPDQVNIRVLSDLLSGSDMVQPLHRHHFFYLLALRKGSGTHSIDFNHYEVADHVIFFMRPGQVHELTLKSISEGYLLEFAVDFYHPHDIVLNELLRKAGNQNYYAPDGISFENINTVLHHILLEFQSKKEKYLDAIKANLSLLFIALARVHDEGNSKKTAGYGQQRLEALLELLEKHISTHKQVTQYAGMLNISAYQLNAITKETLGKTCSEMINEHIILEAKRYLLATTNQVNQIADQLGYEDASYFIRFFKKQTGYPPEAFRQNFNICY